MSMFRKTVGWRCSGNKDGNCENYINKTKLERGAWFCPKCPSDVIEDKVLNIPVAAAAGGACLLVTIALGVWAYHAVVRSGERAVGTVGKGVTELLGSSGTQGEKKILQNIESVFYKDPLLKKAPIKVTMKGHTAWLHGFVPTQQAREHADRDALEIPGVNSVNDDNLMVGSAPEPTAASNSSKHVMPVNRPSTAHRETARVSREIHRRPALIVHRPPPQPVQVKKQPVAEAARSDKQIRNDLLESLAQDPVLQTARSMYVTFAHGDATLSGPMPSQAVIDEAVRRAHSVHGVLHVINRLYVEPPQQAVQAPPPQPQQQPQPVTVTVPVGTRIEVRTNQTIDSSRDRDGQEFSATVESQVVEGNHVAIPRLCEARLRLVYVHEAGHFRGRSEIQLQLVSIKVGGKTYFVDSDTYRVLAAHSRGRQTAERTGIGAALGGVIGGILGGGKGAAIGAGIGAGGGAGVQAATRPAPAKIPAEDMLNFTLRSPLSIMIKP